VTFFFIRQFFEFAAVLDVWSVTKEIGGAGHVGLKISNKTGSIENQCGSFANRE
jgi:hypothetical protein